MKSITQLSVLTLIILAIISCGKANEPVPRICPEEPETITTQDTLILENCSEYYNEQRWEMPNGTFSLNNKVSFFNQTVGTYTIVLNVRNDDYANFYRTTRIVKVENP